MLKRLLNLLSDHPGQLNQEQICTELGISPSSLQTMLDILVRKGRLEEKTISAEGTCTTACELCPALIHCSQDRGPQESYYQIAAKP